MTSWNVSRTSQVDPEDAPWRGEPLAPGAWRKVSAGDAAHLLDLLPLAVLEAAPFPLVTFWVRMRAQSIVCLPGWSLIEAEICTGIGYYAILRLLADASTVLPLDGSANPFRMAALHDFDARKLSDGHATRQYLRVYVGSVHTDGWGFGIHGSPGSRGDGGIVVRPCDDGSAVCLTRVQHQDQLFVARFGISTSGDVTILKDCFLGRRCVSHNQLLHGPWQVIGLN